MRELQNNPTNIMPAFSADITPARPPSAHPFPYSTISNNTGPQAQAAKGQTAAQSSPEPKSLRDQSRHPATPDQTRPTKRGRAYNPPPNPKSTHFSQVDPLIQTRLQPTI